MKQKLRCMRIRPRRRTTLCLRNRGTYNIEKTGLYYIRQEGLATINFDRTKATSIGLIHFPYRRSVSSYILLKEDLHELKITCGKSVLAFSEQSPILFLLRKRNKIINLEATYRPGNLLELKFFAEQARKGPQNASR